MSGTYKAVEVAERGAEVCRNGVIMKVIVKCHHPTDESCHQINGEEMCTQCAIELASKIANELIIHRKATLMYALRPQAMS
jgi:hypothetical protein